jgi:hypothetical protein
MQEGRGGGWHKTQAQAVSCSITNALGKMMSTLTGFLLTTAEQKQNTTNKSI